MPRLWHVDPTESEGILIMEQPDILFQIASAIVIATCFALVARVARQPLILAYIAAGIVVGPTEGLGWLSIETVEPISELGLILLLFMIGLEIDLKKIKQSGAALIAVGVGQFLICVLLGLPFMRLLGFHLGGGDFSALYLAIGAALSSTMIVVKLLYDKFELDTLPGRMTLGILVFQDIWAILFLALQHDLRIQRPVSCSSRSPRVSVSSFLLYSPAGTFCRDSSTPSQSVLNW